jgi:glycerate dehydrogenase
MTRFKRLVVLDRIILLEEQWERLHNYAEEVLEFSRLNPHELLMKLHEEMEADPKPMCWTQLAVEQVTTEELNRRLRGADAVITCWTGIPDNVLQANPQIRYIGFWTNLAAHRVNLDLARELGIHVTYIPDYGTDSVAEMTFCGMLAVARKLIRNHHDTLRGSWPYELIKTGKYLPRADQIPQHLLKGKLLGIVGFGRIGRRVAEIALAFHMRVQYWSRHRYPEWEARGTRYVELEELFETSDIVSVHLSPYAPEKIINGSLLRRLKDGAIFVNTSSGRLVDQEALFDELSRGRIYAYLDVYEGLPTRKEMKQLNTYDNVFTYRSGWYTQEAVVYKGEALLKNIEDFLRGNPGTPAWEQEGFVEPFTELPCAPRDL